MKTTRAIKTRIDTAEKHYAEIKMGVEFLIAEHRDLTAEAKSRRGSVQHAVMLIEGLRGTPQMSEHVADTLLGFLRHKE